MKYFGFGVGRGLGRRVGSGDGAGLVGTEVGSKLCVGASDGSGLGVHGELLQTYILS